MHKLQCILLILTMGKDLPFITSNAILLKVGFDIVLNTTLGIRSMHCIKILERFCAGVI